jgi:hypothetical protein
MKSTDDHSASLPSKPGAGPMPLRKSLLVNASRTVA